MTFGERLLWKHLCDEQFDGWHFRRQHPIGPYIVDFYCARANLVIEIDGDLHAEQSAYDDARSRWLAEQHHFRVLRFAERDVQQSVAEVVEAIRGALSESPQVPPP